MLAENKKLAVLRLRPFSKYCPNDSIGIHNESTLQEDTTFSSITHRKGENTWIRPLVIRFSLLPASGEEERGKRPRSFVRSFVRSYYCDAVMLELSALALASYYNYSQGALL